MALDVDRDELNLGKAGLGEQTVERGGADRYLLDGPADLLDPLETIRE